MKLKQNILITFETVWKLSQTKTLQPSQPVKKNV